jgi:LAO/AO transport system kinase
LRIALAKLRELFPYTGRSLTIGITGSPGAGKSTLVDKLAEAYRGEDKKVGILAVDPSSPFTGGAILGDRIRMQSQLLDPGTFIRSMATRGHFGGLTRATADALTVMDAAGFDIVLVETVGVGQGEIEIARTADVTMLLLVPGMGDDIQIMKAGIMEIGDMFIVNKADKPGADRIEAELNGLLSMGNRRDGWNPPIIRTIASEGSGIREAYRSFMPDSEHRRDRVVQIQKDRLLELVCQHAKEALLQNNETADRIRDLSVLIADRKLDPFTAADEILALHWDRIATGHNG